MATAKFGAEEPVFVEASNSEIDVTSIKTGMTIAS